MDQGRRSRLLKVTSLALGLLGGIWHGPARAIDIQLVYDDLGENPDFDASGTGLMAVAQAAAQIWEDLLPMAGTYVLDVSWSFLEDTQLGLWKGDVGNDNIYFNSNKSWFIDPTPLEHSEFDFGDPFELSDSWGPGLVKYDPNAASYFNGTAPDALEISYRGRALESGPADNVNDLLTVILHEMGHELGVNDDPFSTVYPVYPQHVLGVTDLEVQGADDVDHEDGDAGHLGPPLAVLTGVGTGPSQRRLPTAVDVLAVAWDESFTTVDLDRKYFGQGTNWNSGGNWIGGSVPNGDDDAYLVDGGFSVELTANGSARDLYIDSGRLETNGHALTLGGLAKIAGCNCSLGPAFTRIVVESGGEMVLQDLEIDRQGDLELRGGILTINGIGTVGRAPPPDAEINDFLGSITGHGSLIVNGTLRLIGTFEVTQLVALGRIDIENGGLTLDGIGAVDLDGQINANGGNLSVGARLFTSSRGEINLLNGNDLVLLEDWTVNADLSLRNGSTVVGANAAADLIVADQISAVAGSSAVATNGAVFLALFGDAGHSVANNAELRLESNSTHLRGVSFFGSGTLVQTRDLTVGVDNEVTDTTNTETVTRIDTSVFDWGNSIAGQRNDILVTAGATLLIDSQNSGTAANPYRGNITVNSGTLAVNFTDGWRLPADPASLLQPPGGRLSLQNVGAGTPTLRGNMLTVANFLTASGGRAIIEAPLTVVPGGTVNVQTGAEIEWRGPVTLAGGAVNGNGRIEQRDDITVTSDTTITPGEFGWGLSGAPTQPLDTLRVVAGTTLTIYAPTGISGNPYRGVVHLDGGTLQYFTGETWTLPGPDPRGGLHGGTLLMNRAVGRFGATSSAIEGDDFIVHGTIDVSDPSAEIDANVEIHGDAEIAVGLGAELWLNEVSTLRGGEWRGPGTLGQGGDFIVAADTTIGTGSFDWGNSNVFEDHQLTINPGATLTVNSPVLGGPGNAFNGTLRIDRGTLIVNSLDGWSLPLAGGILDAGNVQMNTSGTENAKLGGVELTVHNHLIASGGGTAEIDNTVTIVNGGRLSMLSNTLLRIDGVLNYEPGAITQGTGRINVAAGGELHGGGTVSADVTLNGLFDPSLGGPAGAPAGIGAFTFGDDLTVLPSAVFAFDLAGPFFDTLDVVDSVAILGGELWVSLLPGYTPMSGDGFDLLTANSIGGGFDDLVLPLLTPGLQWSFDKILNIDGLGTDALRLSVTGSPIPVPGLGWLAAVLAAAALRRRAAAQG